MPKNNTPSEELFHTQNIHDLRALIKNPRRLHLQLPILKTLYGWYMKNDPLILQKYPQVPAQLADALTCCAEQLKASNTVAAARAMARAESVLSTLPRQSILAPQTQGRANLHQAYQRLTQEYDKRINRNPPGDPALRRQAGFYQLMALRTANFVEPFDHSQFLATFKEEKHLPSSGICNAFTSEAIRFYAKKKNREPHDTFINKMQRKSAGKEKARRFLQRLNILQKHDVSADTLTQSKGLPHFAACKKMLRQQDIQAIEVLIDLGRTSKKAGRIHALKHSLLVRCSRNKNRELTDLHIIDANLGEAHFPVTPAGIKNFNATIKKLQKAYAQQFGTIQYAFIRKEKALMTCKALLFAPSSEGMKAKPTLTFRDKVRGVFKRGP